MKHIYIVEYGTFLSLKSERLVIQNKSETELNKNIEYPLVRIKTISINKTGVSLSSSLISECASRGIKIFIVGYNNKSIAVLIGVQQNAVAQVRRKQFLFLDSSLSIELAKVLIFSKIRNQRATLLYFGKYLGKISPEVKNEIINKTCEKLENSAKQLFEITTEGEDKNLYQSILGIEGYAANLYWDCLRNSELFPKSFKSREKRGTLEIINSSLNFGYTILLNIIWHCVINAGLEAYYGCLHKVRPGKPSLVLDLMEEYRAWVVDRVIIKYSYTIEKEKVLNSKVRKIIISEINKTLTKKYFYKKKKVNLETIIQRQIYNLVGCFMEDKKYTPFLFRW